MKNKSLYIFLILIILTISLGAVNASENISNSTSDVLVIENDVLELSNDEIQSAEDQATFSELIDEFSSYSGGNIELSKKLYTYDSGDTIEIKYGGIIDGKGAIIDMLGSHIRAFNVDGGNESIFVTFRNLTIMNANFDGDGSAIYFKDKGTIEYCTFINNTASDNGGAIFFNSDANVSDSEFRDNKVKLYSGGAIYVYSSLSNCLVVNCNFTNNFASDRGGAIYSFGNNTIEKSKFVNNSVNGLGGAIFFQIIDSIDECDFINNIADFGGAIFSQIIDSIDECDFINNTADYGGAICSISGNEINNSNFIYNSAIGGGACYFEDISHINTCDFIDNHADDAGAIRMVKGTVNKCNFENNSANNTGGAIVGYEGDVTNCNFTNNSANTAGGAILFNDEGNIKGCNFIDNSASLGGAVFFYSSGSVNNCNFTNRVSSSSYGTGVYISAEGNVNNSNFYNNVAEFYGGAIYSSLGNVSNSNFYNNFAGYNGGAIFMSWGNVENCDFINNSVDYYGGALYLSLGNVKDSYFLNNAAGYYGGAIVTNQLYCLENSTFLQNKADIGSAIYIMDGNNHSIVDSTFLDNQANSTSLKINNSANSIEISFMGYDNILNAIYSVVNVNLTNVTYWGVYGVTNSGHSTITSTMSNYEAGQSIEIVIYINDILYMNTTGFTGLDGKILLDAVAGSYNIAVCHKNDSYYNEIKASSKFDIPGTPTKLDLSYSGTIVTAKVSNAYSGNVAFTVKKGDDIIKISGSTLVNGIATFDASDLGSGEYNITALYMGSSTLEPSINNITYIFFKKNSTILIEAENITTNQKEIINFTVNGESDKNLIVYLNNNKYDVYDGKLVLTGLKEGIYHLTAFWSGDDEYNMQSNSTTFRVIEDLKYYVNVTSIKSNNKRINLTAKSNINEAIVGGRLFFVLENLSEIEAEYGGGIWWASYSFPNNGDYEITARYVGLDDVAINKAIITIRNDTLFNISADNIDYGDLVNVTVNLLSDAHGNVTLLVGDKKYLINDINGSFVYTIPDKFAGGNYIVQASYSGDLNYSSNNSSDNFVINKATPEIIISAPGIVVGNVAVISAYVPASGKINIVINDKDYVVDSGDAINISDLSMGNYNVFVFYEGDENYTFATNKSILTVDKNSTYEFDFDVEIIGEDVVIDVDLPEDAKGNLTVVFGDEVYEFPANKTLVIKDLKPGKYNMSVIYGGDDKYDSKSVNKTVDVDNIRLIVNNLVKYCGGSDRLVIALVNHDGRAISSKLVNIRINGVDYSRTTNSEGIASIAINLHSANYTARVDVPEYSLSSEVNVEVLPTIHASDVIKVFCNATQYYALFLDGKGNPLADANVSFNINGVFYTRSTNGSGYAKLNINLDEGSYVLTAHNPVTGEMKSNNITVIALIESSDLTKYYKNESQFTVRLIGSDGSYVGAGEKVTFNINGVFYTRITNETGHAKLNINLNPGSYIITSEYKGCYVSNNIEVLSVLSANDLTKRYGSPDQFVATLIDGQGKAFANQVIGFNINGVFYNRTTDVDGKARLNINLMAGEYIITSSFNELNISNTIKVTA